MDGNYGGANTSFTFIGVPGEEPGGEVPQPPTGDATVAMFAVIVVLAMSAAFVFIRRKSY